MDSYSRKNRTFQLQESVSDSLISQKVGEGATIQLYAFSKDADNYDYGIDFLWHLSDQTGDGLKAVAIKNSKRIEGNYVTTINQSSLEGGEFNIVNATGRYDFGIEIDGVETISASDRHKTSEEIDSVVVEGYNMITKKGNPWYKITHLNVGS